MKLLLKAYSRDLIPGELYLFVCPLQVLRLKALAIQVVQSTLFLLLAGSRQAVQI